MRTAYIIDYSNWYHKFLKVMYSKEHISVPKFGKRDISALKGFMKSIEAIDADDIYLALDGYPKMCLSMRPEYKSGRQHSLPDVPPLEMVYTLGALQQYAIHMRKRLHICYCPFEEADSVISSLAFNLLGKCEFATYNRLNLFSMHSVVDDPRLSSINRHLLDETPVPCFRAEPYDRVIIGSADSDLYQCKEYGPVYFDRSTTGKDIDYSDDTPNAVGNVPPHCIAIYKACCGDKSDNIPSTIPSILKKPLTEFLSGLAAGQADFYLNDLQCAGQQDMHSKLKANFSIDDTSGVLDYFKNDWKQWMELVRNIRMVQLSKFLLVKEAEFDDIFASRCASIFANLTPYASTKR